MCWKCATSWMRAPPSCSPPRSTLTSTPRPPSRRC
jgi:hypothetical protein